MGEETRSPRGVRPIAQYARFDKRNESEKSHDSARACGYQCPNVT